MWSDWLTEHGFELRDPATAAKIDAAEGTLGVTFPPDLRALLLETDGASGKHGGCRVNRRGVRRG